MNPIVVEWTGDVLCALNAGAHAAWVRLDPDYQPELPENRKAPAHTVNSVLELESILMGTDVG